MAPSLLEIDIIRNRLFSIVPSISMIISINRNDLVSSLWVIYVIRNVLFSITLCISIIIWIYREHDDSVYFGNRYHKK